MNPTLLIRFSRDLAGETIASWASCDAQGALSAPPLSGPLLAAASNLAGRDVVVLVPADEVVSLTVEVPTKSGSKWQQAVPFAVEEQFAEAVEDMHVAIGERLSDSNRVAVAAVARSRMRGWQEQLSAAGIGVHAIYSESALLPASPGQVVALLQGDSLLIRRANENALTVPADPLGPAFDLVCGAEELGRHSLLLYAGPTDWHKRSDQVDALRERFLTVKVQLLPQGPLPLLAQQLPLVKPTNLLQGEFAPTAHRGGGWRDWRMAAALALLMLATFVGGRFWELSNLKNNEATVDARLAELGQALLPPGSAPSDPAQLRASMAERLGGARGDPNDVMLEILAALAQARTAAPQTRIESARFQDGALELKLRADTADSLEKINAQLRASGWQAELLSGATNGTAFEGRVRIAGSKPT